MDTPIWDFVETYRRQGTHRLHMPGHKGQGEWGFEPWDITEIEGADALFTADGIIAASESNAATLFGARRTLYSTEGSSLCVRTMVALMVRLAAQRGVRPLILATRNAHQSFLSAVSTCRAEVAWLYGREAHNYMRCPITVEDVTAALDALPMPPVALYVTSPDYLGYMAPLGQLARLCHQRGVLLLVDNAHGAYLRFVGEHPMSVGADLCCDSAHKTLPALTGCAYLHVGAEAPAFVDEYAKSTMARFATTSPSYLQLVSLDRLNAVLDDWAPIARRFAMRVADLRRDLTALGYDVVGDEPFKLTLATRAYGYTGGQVAAYLGDKGLTCEMHTPEYVVCLLSPSLDEDALPALYAALAALPELPALAPFTLTACRPAVAMPVYQAAWAPCERIPLDLALGRVVADNALRCPPAVPIVVPGEIVDADVLCALRQTGETHITVVR